MMKLFEPWLTGALSAVRRSGVYSAGLCPHSAEASAPFGRGIQSPVAVASRREWGDLARFFCCECPVLFRRLKHRDSDHPSLYFALQITGSRGSVSNFYPKFYAKILLNRFAAANDGRRQ